MLAPQQKTYTDEENLLWSELFDEADEKIWQKNAFDGYRNHLQYLGITRERVLDLNKVGEKLRPLEWQIVPVKSIAPAGDLAEYLATNRFPVCTGIRPREKRSRYEFPDVFHDGPGHTGPLVNEKISTCMRAFGQQGKIALARSCIGLWDRVFYQGAEVGLLKTSDGFKVFGPALLTSIEETQHALSGDVERKRFDLAEIIQKPFSDANVQEVYYWVESFDELLRDLQLDWSQYYPAEA